MEEAPRVRVAIEAIKPDIEPGRWWVAWLLRNEAQEPLGLEAVWVPHGRFRGEGRLSLDGELTAGQARRLEVRVAAQEKPGTIIDNAFLVLRVRVHDQRWRIFTRMRIAFDAAGVPWPMCELVTVARIGRCR